MFSSRQKERDLTPTKDINIDIYCYYFQPVRLSTCVVTTVRMVDTRTGTDVTRATASWDQVGYTGNKSACLKPAALHEVLLLRHSTNERQSY